MPRTEVVLRVNLRRTVPVAYRQLSIGQKRIKKVEPINLLQDVETKKASTNTINIYKYDKYALGSYSPSVFLTSIFPVWW